MSLVARQRHLCQLYRFCLLFSATTMAITIDKGGLVTGVLLIDLRKASDTVNYIMLAKLQGVGINCIEDHWFSSYLTGR